MTNKIMLRVEKILIGIDKDEAEHPEGWWPNSVGAEFGAKKLQELRALLDKPAAQDQGDPVVGHCTHPPGCKFCSWCGFKAEHPATVAGHPQCEECKGWGYHENHHEGGGTECGECGGSGNATVAVVMVMPDRMEVEPFTTIDRGSKNYKAGYNAALAEVARLNGVKP